MRRAAVVLLALLALVGLAGCGPVVAFQEPRQPVFAAEEVFPGDIAPQVAANAAGPVREQLTQNGRAQLEDCSAFNQRWAERYPCGRSMNANFQTADRALYVGVTVMIMANPQEAASLDGTLSIEYLQHDRLQISGGYVGRYAIIVGVYDGSRGSSLSGSAPLTGELAERARALAHGTRVFLEDSLKQRVGL